MATARIGETTRRAAAAAVAREAEAGRRRAARVPAGWLLVEAETTSGGQKLAGRLLDMSEGGLGLVLDDDVTVGTMVRVSPQTIGPATEHEFWHGRRARVAYAVPLPGGSWRVGLTFAAPAQGSLQIWGTRALLLAVFVIASVSALFSDTTGAIAGVVLGAIAVSLAVGAEWQHHAEVRAAHYGPPKAILNR